MTTFRVTVRTMHTSVTFSAIAASTSEAAVIGEQIYGDAVMGITVMRVGK